MNEPVAPLSLDGVGEDSIPELVQLGEALMRAREGAGFSLEALAARLRVEPRLLQALEQGDHLRLPEGVFIVALARRIAGTLNANVEEGIASVRQSRLMEPRPVDRSRSSRTPDPSPRRTEPTQKPPQQISGPSGRPVPIPLWGWALAALLTTLGATAGWLLQAPSPSRRPSPSPEPEPTPSPAPERVVPPPSSLQPTQVTKPGAMTSNAGNTLRLQASEPSWLEVRDTNGKTLFEGTLTGERSFPLGRGLEVMAGRPYAVRASTGTGQAAPLGGVDDIRWKRFSPQPLMPAASPPSTPSP
ncbi:MAG: RodZ domain-containing protein [Cyanobacteriota bacterium]|nr:RodZ domain-containing protein [Cyanobacteriota bacterium]